MTFRDLITDTFTLIARLELTSNGTTRNWESDGRGSSGEAIYPAHGHKKAPKGMTKELGDFEPEFLVLRRRAVACVDQRDEIGLRKVHSEAERELRLARRGPKPKKLEAGTIAWMREIANSPKPVAEVARLYMVSRQTVYNYRAKYREPEKSLHAA